MEFHHLDPNNKIFGISKGLNKFYRLDILMEEVKKCVLLCPNCHAEIHANALDISKYL